MFPSLNKIEDSMIKKVKNPLKFENKEMNVMFLDFPIANVTRNLYFLY